jgi:uncharacterized repeat protein (TIGR03803 family)
MRTIFALPVLAATIALAACGSGSTTPPTPRPTAAAAKVNVVYGFLQKERRGTYPVAPLVSYGSELFGTTLYTLNRVCCGSVYAVTPAGGYRLLHRFGSGDDGRYPYAGMIVFKNQLWGTTGNGGGAGCTIGCGTVFSIDPASGAETVQYAFKGTSNDGAYPEGGLVAYNGKLYGTTVNGGVGCFPKGCGTVFEFDPATNAERLVYAFRGSEGAYPHAGLIVHGGTLYGTTVNGGTACGGTGCGTVFAIHPTQRSERVVYNFKGGAKDGDHPYSDLLLVGDRLWGTTLDGGFSGRGTVFAVDIHSQKEVEHYHFKGGSDGAYPRSGVIVTNGLLYGATWRGGGACVVVYGCGTVFSLDPSNGSETMLHAFSGDPDGSGPMAALTNVSGTLYGSTESGGAGPPNGCFQGCGIVFSVTP